MGSVAPEDDDSDGLSIGVIIGIVAAILAFIFIILVICIICITWRRSRYRERKERIIDSIYADNRRYYYILLRWWPNGVFTLSDTETKTETDKSGFCRIVWRCSYISKTETYLNLQGFYVCFIGICMGLNPGVGQCE